MGWFDWLGPTSLAKRRGWDALPAPPSESKAADLLSPMVPQISVPILVHGPGTPPWTLGGYGTGDGNSAVFACLQVLATAIGEPELKVYREAPTGRVVVESSPLGELLARPNPAFALDTLLGYLSNSLHVDGNAYWRKLRAGDPDTGNVVELWPIAPSRVVPWTDPDAPGDFITAYRYQYAPGRFETIPTWNIVHFRYGIDDGDHRRGTSPLKRLAAEVSSDAQATRYADRLLANLAINGLTLTFDKESPPISQAQAEELKARIRLNYGGDQVGSVGVLSPGASLHALGFSPEQMDMKTLHRVPEERISAVLGVPAIVAGLGAGLDHATYANVEQAREAFTETKLLPLWKSIAADITLQLVPDFVSDRSTVVAFDTSEVRALALDQNALAVRLTTLVAGGVITADEARAEIGRQPIGDNVLRLPASSQPPSEPPVAASYRPRLVTLSRRVETKSADDLPRDFDAMRSADLPDWVDELVSFFEGQRRRVVRRLRSGADTADDLVPELEVERLARTLEPLQLDALDEVSRLVVAELGVAFDLDDPATRRYLADAGVNIVGITDTTREQVRAALTEGQMAGEGIPQLARRLYELPAFSAARATTCARTELGTAQNTAALASYRASGVVVGVRVLDGDYDAACAAMDGRTFALGQEPAMLQHPNCVRAFAPLVDPAELVRSA